MGISPLRTFDSFHQTNFEYILYTASSYSNKRRIPSPSTMVSGLMFNVTTLTISSLINFCSSIRTLLHEGLQ